VPTASPILPLFLSFCLRGFEAPPTALRFECAARVPRCTSSAAPQI
jgi:hypothetical protein